jgi:5,10-methenyltetrahydrofolate synthetase
VREVGAESIVLDLSCKATADGWRVAMNRWQMLTDLEVNTETLDRLADSCAEFLVHAVDVEGKCEGIDHSLARYLGAWGKRPLTYAGGITRLDDLWTIHELSGGAMDATVGSALDLFGGNGVRYKDCIAFTHAADEKARLRVIMKVRLRQAVVDESEGIMAQLKHWEAAWLPTSGVVALFGGLKGEPDLLSLIEWLAERGVGAAFMDFADGTLTPRLVTSASDLQRGPFGAWVPAATCPEVPGVDVKVVLTPGLAFGLDGSRLGRGKGFYDRFFAVHPEVRRLGVGCDEQILPTVPMDAHDQRMHAVVTGTRLLDT